jgi:hypothetical protein
VSSLKTTIITPPALQRICSLLRLTNIQVQQEDVQQQEGQAKEVLSSPYQVNIAFL